MSNVVQRLIKARELAEDIESDMVGMQINHPDHDYCIVEFIDGDNVSLYCEDEEGNVEHIGIYLEDLEDYLI